MENAPINVKLKKNAYTIDFKLKCIQKVESGVSIHKVAEIAGVDRSSLRDWIKQKDELLKKDHKQNSFRLQGAGKKPMTIEIEEQLIKFILECRHQQIALNSHEIITKAQSLTDALEGKSYKSLMNWCYKFLKRAGFSIRKPTHIGQPLKEDSNALFDRFIFNIITFRKEMEIFEELNRIGNVDETPIWFDMTYNTTIAKIGEKSIKVRTFGGERLRVSLILCILANGDKLPPLVIFKGSKNGRKENSLKENIHVKKNEIYILCQENAWASEDIFFEWLKKVWFRSYPNIKSSGNTLLVLDRATTHFSERINDLFVENKSKYVFIPPGATRYLQPLDFAINKPFKDSMRKKYTEFVIKYGGNKKPVSEDLIEWIISSWYDPKVIPKEMIINSFKKTAISNKMDGSEDSMFEWPEELAKDFDFSQLETDE